MNRHNKWITIFTIILIFLSLTATLGGLFIDNLYQDNVQFTQIWKSNDIITLCVALPLLIGAMVYTYLKKSIISLLIWYSMIWFLCYN